MNNQDYLEYEGARLLARSLDTYGKGTSGEIAADLAKRLANDQKEISEAEREALLALSWEYVLFRLYVATSIIEGWKGCFGCQRTILSGVKSILTSLPEQLKLLALEKDLAGSYLVLGNHVAHLTEDHVKGMFACYEEIDRAASRMEESRLTLSIEASLARMAEEVAAPLTPSMVNYLTAETKSFMAALHQRLSQMTPERIHQKAHKKTVLHTQGSVFSQENYERLYPSFTLAATMAAGFLFMFA